MAQKRRAAFRFGAVQLRYGTVELGGTKTSCSVGSTPDDLSDVLTIPTADPPQTLGQVLDHLGAHSIAAVGIASFGPVGLRRERADYGHITITPKEGWSGADVVGRFQTSLGVPIGFDTDVNGAALGEWKWGAGQGLGSFVYVTVGTGIGGGALIEGVPIHGLGHPEMGHISVRRHPDDVYPGACRLHGDCLEGLASGPAMESRFGVAGARLSGEELGLARRIEAFYLAQLVRNLIYTLAPERVILGGGVSQMPGLLRGVAEALEDELSGYPGFAEHRAGFVVPPGLGPLSGLAGGLVLAADAMSSA
jgi:fructokinase